MEDDVSMATQACLALSKSFVEDDDACNGHTDLALTQEDFGSATSFMQDVVKVTDPQLNLVLAEGGGEPGKNRFRDKQTKVNPLSPSARYRIYQSERQNSFLKKD